MKRVILSFALGGLLPVCRAELARDDAGYLRRKWRENLADTEGATALVASYAKLAGN